MGRSYLDLSLAGLQYLQPLSTLLRNKLTVLICHGICNKIGHKYAKKGNVTN